MRLFCELFVGVKYVGLRLGGISPVEEWQVGKFDDAGMLLTRSTSHFRCLH